MPKCWRAVVSLGYSGDDLRRVFGLARREDIHAGGVYDARAAVINVWSRPWSSPDSKWKSEILCSFYFRWGRETGLWCVEWPDGATEEQAYAALGRLETAALGRTEYGSAVEVEQ